MCSSDLALLVFVMATFALVGVAEFKHVGVGAPTAPPAPPLNFQAFGSAMFVMVQLSMVAGWPELLLDYIGKETECDATASNCGYRRAGVIFIVVYTALSFLIVTNMFLVLVLEMVDQLRQRQSGSPCRSRADGGGGASKRVQEVASAGDRKSVV